ncbi:MAG: hypothetical protein HY862_10025 [Chloroflexi bacterium]|nr:hypothetical protein [Chloroflexota bacterium]
MGIGDSILAISCLAGLMLALPALLIFLNLGFYDTSTRAATRLAKGAITPFFVGLVPILFIGLPAGLLISVGSVMQACGTIFMLLVALWAFWGLAVVARLIGMRIAWMNRRDENALVESITGAFALSFAIAFPVIGWFIVLPFGLIIGLGAIVMTMAGRFGRIFTGNPQPRPVVSPPAASQHPTYEPQPAEA